MMMIIIIMLMMMQMMDDADDDADDGGACHAASPACRLATRRNAFQLYYTKSVSSPPTSLQVQKY